VSKETLLIDQIKQTYTGSTRKQIINRLKQFKEVRKKGSNAIFNELCFCLLTANFQAERSILIQSKINDGFLTYNQEELERFLRKFGHRFPKKRAEYIVLARNKKEEVMRLIFNENSDYEKREWLVRNIKGLGMKEASHFLRNIGVENMAIIDFHIIDLLVKYNIINRPKTLTKRRYLEIEGRLKQIGKKVGLSLAALDLILWKIETGKILK